MILYGLGAITLMFFINCSFVERFVFVGKALTTRVEARQVLSAQARNPGIYSVFARLLFVSWFRDPSLPGRHNSKELLYTVCSNAFFVCRKAFKTTLGVMIGCEYGTSSSEVYWSLQVPVPRTTDHTDKLTIASSGVMIA